MKPSPAEYALYLLAIVCICSALVVTRMCALGLLEMAHSALDRREVE